MKKNRLSLAFLSLLIAASPLRAQDTLQNETVEQKDKRMEWFSQAKLGIFIHWGIYSVRGVSESWSFFNNYLPYDEYMEQEKGFTDPRKANQMVRGVVSLRHGTGKQVRVLVLCTPDAEAAAKEAGADYVGLDEYIEKIKGGWTDIDVIITMPSIMGKIGALGRVLGPRGLMPNPKSGTVTMDVAKAVKEVKQGKIDLRKNVELMYASIPPKKILERL